MYSHPHTTLFGHCSCRFTGKIYGIGLGERAWGGTKTIKEGKRCSIGGEFIVIRYVLYITAHIDDACLMKETDIKNLDHDMFEEDDFT